jgi:hypothetical protein
MTAVSFLPRNVSVKVNPIISLAKRKPLQPKHEFNYSVISLLNLDVIDALSVYAKKGIIKDKGLEVFEEKVNKDVNQYFEKSSIFHKYNDVNSDFDMIVNFFKKLSERCLSNYQKQSEPILQDLLTTIFQIEYMVYEIPILIACQNRTPAKKPFDYLKQKLEELKKAFMQVYVNYSNKKEFNFEIYKGVFSRMSNMGYKEFVKFAKEDFK